MKRKNFSFIQLFWTLWLVPAFLHAQVEFENISAGLEGDNFYKVVYKGKNDVFVYANSGIWHSPDLGKTWELKNAHPPPYCFFEADSAGNLYIGYFGIYRSQDQGKTWQVVVPPRIEEQPTTKEPYRVHLLGMYVSRNDALNWRYNTDKQGYWRSTDQGTSHQEITGEQYYYQPDEKGFMYKSDGFYLFQSTDAVKWNTVPFRGQISQFATSFSGNILVVSNIKPYISFDAGKTFRLLPFDSQICPNCQHTYTINNSGGVKISWTLGTETFTYFTDDLGVTWKKYTTNEGVSTPTTPYTLFKNRGTKWIAPRILEDRIVEGSLVFDPKIKTWMSLSNHEPTWNTPYGWVEVKDFLNGKEIWLSPDKGQTWQKKGNYTNHLKHIFSDGNIVFEKKTIEIQPKKQYFIAPLDNLQESYDLKLDLPDNVSPRFFTANGVYFAMWSVFQSDVKKTDNIVFRSQDKGKTWEKVIWKDMEARFKRLFFYLNMKTLPDGAWLLNTTNLENPVARNEYYLSRDEGQSWKLISTKGYILTTIEGYQNRFSNVMNVDLAGNLWTLGYSESDYFAKTNPLGEMKARLLYSRDFGESWQEVQVNVNGFNITQLYLDTAGFLYITTENGLFRSKRALQYSFDTKPETNYTEIKLHPPFPNPVSKVTSFSFDLPETNDISLRIRNLLGQEIQVLHHGELLRGNYMFTWNTSQMPSGVYFAQLEANGITKTQRVVVVR